MKKLLSKLFLKIMGWKLVGDVPKEVKKAVMVCAPHTSNWDFPFALASFTITGLKVNYFIKKSWFFFPMNFLFKATGGVPVDRSKNHGMVDSMTMLLKESNEMIVVVPAEGTRSWVPKWKSGFYHIAKNANVPLLMGFVDYKKKEVGFGPLIYLTDELEKDMLQIQNFFKDKTPKYRDKYNPVIF
ncbi:MAG: 1-acyl-sn-glycerol-3-phosphate acyltransferase [Flavobacteriales bacterium]|nr:1-acyl-sn-glycerol-3-phosphate acyltransferase [Flavobacteriales bacterium]